PLYALRGIGMLVQGGTREYPGDHRGDVVLKSIQQIRWRILVGEEPRALGPAGFHRKERQQPFLAHAERLELLLDAICIAAELLRIRQAALAHEDHPVALLQPIEVPEDAEIGRRLEIIQAARGK